MSKFKFGNKYEVLGKTSGDKWRIDAKPEFPLTMKPSYSEIFGYGKSSTITCTKYHVSLHELRNVLPYIDIKFCTPENWKSLAEQLLAVFPHGGELLVEFIRKNAPQSAMTGNPNLITHVQEYIKNRPVNFALVLRNVNTYYQKLGSLTYFVKPEQTSNFQQFVQMLSKDTFILSNISNVLGQMREELISMNISDLPTLVDKVITSYRNKIHVHNHQLRTCSKVYTYKQARQILGTYLIGDKQYDILEIIDMCPYFQANVDTIPNVGLFCEQVSNGSYKLSGSKRDIVSTSLWYEYKKWCTDMKIVSPESETEFCWNSSLPTDETGVIFVTSKLSSIRWMN